MLLWTLFFFQSFSFSLQHNAFSVGVGYFSENTLGKITKDDSGEKSFLGTPTYPLIFKYDFKIFSTASATDYYVAPKFTYTLLPRKDQGDTIKVTQWHLMIPFGANLGSSKWDLVGGPGIFNRTIDGEGGVIQLNNGGSVAPFAVPGRKVSSQVMTLNLATSYSLDRHRFGFDLMSEALFSDKSTWSFMFSYLYQLNSTTNYERRFR